MSAQDKDKAIPQDDHSDTAAIEHEERTWATPTELKPNPEVASDIASAKEAVAKLPGQLADAAESVKLEQLALDARAKRESEQAALAEERTAHHERAVREANERNAQAEADSDEA